jgi:hypothetical protein
MKSDAPWAVKKALRWKLDDDGADCKVVSVGISHELNIIIILLGKRVVGEHTASYRHFFCWDVIMHECRRLPFTSGLFARMTALVWCRAETAPSILFYLSLVSLKIN